MSLTEAEEQEIIDMKVIPLKRVVTLLSLTFLLIEVT